MNIQTDLEGGLFLFYIKLNSEKAFVANARPEDAIKLRTRILVLC